MAGLSAKSNGVHSNASTVSAFRNAATFAPPNAIDRSKEMSVPKGAEIGKAADAVSESHTKIAQNNAVMDQIDQQLNAGGPQTTGGMGDHSMLKSQAMGYGMAALAGAINPMLGIAVGTAQVVADAYSFVTKGVAIPEEFAFNSDSTSFKSAVDASKDDVYQSAYTPPSSGGETLTQSNTGGSMAANFLNSPAAEKVDTGAFMAMKADLDRDNGALFRQERAHSDYAVDVAMTPEMSPEYKKAFMVPQGPAPTSFGMAA